MDTQNGARKAGGRSFLQKAWLVIRKVAGLGFFQKVSLVVRKAGVSWMDHNAPTYAAALAYYALFSMAPLVVISVAIISFVYGDEVAQGEVLQQIELLAGEEGANGLEALVESTREVRAGSGLLASLVGLVMLLVGASGVFVQLQVSLNNIWGQPEKPSTGVVAFVRRRFLTFMMTLGVGGVLLASLIFTAWLSAAGQMMAGVVPEVTFMQKLLDFGVSFTVITVLFALVYKLLPDVHIAWRDVWLGATVTAALFIGGKYLIGLYLGRSAVTSMYGAAGSFVALLLWVYYSAMIFLFGAEVAQTYARTLGSMSRRERREAERKLEAEGLEGAKKESQM